MKCLVPLLILLMLSLVACGGGSGNEAPATPITAPAATPVPSPTEEPTATTLSDEEPLMSTADIEEAVRVGLPDLGVPVEALKIEINGMVEEYARAVVTTDNPTTPRIIVFLKQEEGQWKVLTHGEGFHDPYLDSLGIPPSLYQLPLEP